jgi:hypothetical protein
VLEALREACGSRSALWPEWQQEDDRIGLPLVCLPLWLGG